MNGRYVHVYKIDTAGSDKQAGHAGAAHRDGSGSRTGGGRRKRWREVVEERDGALESGYEGNYI